MKKLVILTGAGMSAESGLSTFRDSNGLWDKYPVQQVASIEGYNEDPELVINFYNNLRQQLLKTKPNRGHEILAELQKKFDVEVITQNVDNLHERAGSKNVIHLHGELMKITSSHDPNNSKYIKELTPDHPFIKYGEKAEDGSQLRPFIVWFGEAVPMIEKAIEESEEADIFVVIGTSLNVYPAAGLINYVRRGVPIYIIDPKDVGTSSHANIHHIKMGASKGLEELAKILDNE